MLFAGDGGEAFVKTFRRLSAALIWALILCGVFVSCRRIEPDVPASATVTETSRAVHTEKPDKGAGHDTQSHQSETAALSEEQTEPYIPAETTELAPPPPPEIRPGEVSELPGGEELFAPLDELLSRPPVYGANVAFYYEDIESGVSYSFNGDTVMHSASLIKLPYALYLLYEAEEREMGFDEIYTLTGEEDMTGSGDIRNLPVGSTFTYLELIEYSFRVSDNVAFNELRNRYGTYAHFDYVRSIGADSFTQNGGWSLCAKDGAKVLRSAWEYIEGDHLYSDRIKDAMVYSAHTVMLSPGLSGKPIARKYGWDENAYHDMGIVYDTHPYILVFLSDMTSGGHTVDSYITSVARTCDQIHAAIHAED